MRPCYRATTKFSTPALAEIKKESRRLLIQNIKDAKSTPVNSPDGTLRWIVKTTSREGIGGGIGKKCRFLPNTTIGGSLAHMASDTTMVTTNTSMFNAFGGLIVDIDGTYEWIWSSPDGPRKYNLNVNFYDSYDFRKNPFGLLSAFSKEYENLNFLANLKDANGKPLYPTFDVNVSFYSSTGNIYPDEWFNGK